MPVDPHLTSTLVFVIAVPLAVAAFIALLVRSAHRDARARTRLRAGELFRLLSGRVSGRVRGGELRRAAKDTNPEPFWDAVEAITSTLRIRERIALARTLEKPAPGARAARAATTSRRRAGSRGPAAGTLPSVRARRVLRRALVRVPGITFRGRARAARHRDLKALRRLLEHPGALFAGRPALRGRCAASARAGAPCCLRSAQARRHARVECAHQRSASGRAARRAAASPPGS